MAAFEEFWDECCAKLGCHGAQGWKNHLGKYSEVSVKPEGDFKIIIVFQNC